MVAKGPADELRDRIAGVDRLAAQAIALLTDQLAGNGRQVESLARDLNLMRADIHGLDKKITELGNAELRRSVDDHEKRMRIVEDWKSNTAGRQSVITGSIATIVSIAVALVMKLMHT